MRHLMLATTALIAVGVQGCIIYEDECHDCDWDGDWGDGWCDEDAADDPDCRGGDDTGEPDTSEPDPEPEFALFLDPGQAEQGETFLGHLTVEGEFELAAITGVRFTSGVDVLWSENRGEELLILVDVPMDAETGSVDLVVSRDGDDAVLVEDALFVGEPGSGYSSDICE